MCPALNIQQIYTTPPTYIRKILKSNDNVYFIYNNPIKSPNSVENDTIPTIFEKTDVTLDLTGTPLEVDLSCSTMSISTVEDHACLNEGNSYYPLDLNTVRKLINKCIREVNDQQKTPAYVFGVCDGIDKNCTLILGAYQTDKVLDRIQIFHKGCFYQKDPRLSLECLRKEHFSNVPTHVNQVNNVISAVYTVFGDDLRNYKISDSLANSTCIFYNVSWSSFQYDVPDHVQDAEVTVQTITGHRDSRMHTFWEEFSVLKIYTQLLMMQPSDLDKVALSDTPKNYMDIYEEIYSLLNDVQGIRKTILKKKPDNKLDLNNLREEEFSDKLWMILRSCNDVGDLKCCFHSLFEELATNLSLKPIVSEDNKSSIACIINEISCGNLAVPTLTSAQALECLIELGIEKLKNDYSYIINHYDCLDYGTLKTFWDKSIGGTIKNERNEYERNEKITRRIRLTVQPSRSLIDTAERQRILNCLLKMHIACDFLVLENTTIALTGCFNAFVESVNGYILKRTDVSSRNIPDYMLQEIKVKLQLNDVKFLQGKYPTTWNMRLTSFFDRSAVTTIFHHTLKPLFPSCIYNKYDIPAHEESEVYYVTKLVSFSENL